MFENMKSLTIEYGALLDLSGRQVLSANDLPEWLRNIINREIPVYIIIKAEEGSETYTMSIGSKGEVVLTLKA